MVISINHVFFSKLIFLLDVIFLVGILIAVAYFTLLERKVMASVQRRLGPNVVGFYGFLQPLADGLKLLNKEIIIPQRANKLLFLLSPILTFFLSLLVWSFIPFSLSAVLVDADLSLLFIFFLSSLNVYGLILAGWSSNSKYAFLGALRSGAQVISYELVFGFIVLLLAIVAQSFNLIDFMVVQLLSSWFSFLLWPITLLFFVVILAETNRAPFDLAEAEAEIVAGYNVEYSSIIFAMFFLSEYAHMLMMSVLLVIFFMGGCGLAFLSFLFKISFVLLFFIFSRSALPRYRYDQLMALGWKVLLPFCFSYLVFLLGLSVFYVDGIGAR